MVKILFFAYIYIKGEIDGQTEKEKKKENSFQKKME